MNRLREIRKQKGLNQRDVADAVGIARSSYANYECGRREVDHNTLVKLADFFNVSIDHILCRNEKQPIVDDDELRAKAIQRVQALPDPALTRVLDFLEGLEVGREIAADTAVANDQVGRSVE